jgi:sugar/nucleoside kinase (ribokinase family)
MNKDFDVITFGSAIVDFFLNSSEFKLKNNQKLLCQPYEDKIEVDKREICLGGGGTNTAVSLARKGFKVANVVRFGQDFLGQFIINQLKQEQVNLDYLTQIDETTDSSVVLIGPDGGRTILVYRGPTSLTENDVNFSNLNTKWFYLASLEGNLELIKKLISYAQENEVKVFWNPGKRELSQKDKLIPLIEQVNVFMVNRQEAKMILNKDIDQKGFWPGMKELGAKMAIVTDGENGAHIQYSQGVHYLKAPQLEVVDQTGAGDAFGSGFLAGLLNKQEVKPAFELAMDNAASVVQQIGAQTGLIRK